MGKVRAAVQAFVQELTQLWPSLPYLGYGLWLAWSMLVYNGASWLSDTETDGASLAQLYFVSTLAFGLFVVLCGALSRRIAPRLMQPAVLWSAGGIAAIGAVLVVVSGPYYLGSLFWTRPMFWIGAALTGIGTGTLMLRCGMMYSSLPPRRALLYAALSNFVVAFVYFLIVGSPQWAPIAGGPTWVNIATFVLLPLCAAALVQFPQADGTNAGAVALEWEQASPRHNLPIVFWRFIALVFVLSFVTGLIRGSVVANNSPATTLEGNAIVILGRLLVASVFIVVALRFDAGRMNFGKLYTLLAVCMICILAATPLLGAANNAWSIVAYILASAFDIALWATTALIVFQRHTSSVLVFGLGRGAFMIASAFGWFLGTYVLPLLPSGTATTMFYLGLAVVTLLLASLLFSDRDFDRLFEAHSDSEPTYEDMLDIAVKERNDIAKQGRFTKALEHIVVQNKLTPREAEVLHYLAMGRGSDFIAEKLGISWNTARSHTHNVYTKLGVHSRQELIDRIDEAMHDVR